MKLRVGINATPLLSPLTGIGNYITHLAAALDAGGEVDLYAFYGRTWKHSRPAPLVEDLAFNPNASRARDVLKRFAPWVRDMRHAQQQLLFGHGARRNAIELYHEPNYVPFRADVPVVITVHDLSWLRYPGTHPPDRVRWLRREMPRAIERAAAILVDSEFTRREVLAAFARHPQDVHAVHLGVAREFRPRSPEDTLISLREMDLVHGEYLLTVGTIEPRKNVVHALAAYALLPATLRKRYPLVVAGVGGWRAAGLERKLRALANAGQIRMLGHVPHRHLPNLYAGAAAFLYPSHYEGFGLPPLEAMASGVPALVSDRASLPEVTGDAAMMIDPERPELTSAKIEALLESDADRADFARRGLLRAGQFTWETCARGTLGVYHAIRHQTNAR